MYSIRALNSTKTTNQTKKEWERCGWSGVTSQRGDSQKCWEYSTLGPPRRQSLRWIHMQEVCWEVLWNSAGEERKGSRTRQSGKLSCGEILDEALNLE